MTKQELKNYLADKEAILKRRKQNLYAAWSIRVHLWLCRRLHHDAPELVELSRRWRDRYNEVEGPMAPAVRAVVKSILDRHTFRYDVFMPVCDSILSQLDEASDEDVDRFYETLKKI